MKRIALSLLSIAIAGSVAINAEKYRIPVGEFNELVLNDKLNVVYSNNPDSVGFVAFETKPAYAAYIMTENQKSRLKIQLDQEADGITELPTVYVYSSFLSKVENGREGNILIKSVKPTSKITIESQGNGKIEARNLDAVSISLKIKTGKGTIIASGKCKSLECLNIGAGVIEADEIEATDADCRLVGTGTIGCAPTKTLKIKGMGSGKIYYKGNPSIEKSGITTVKTIKLDEAETEVTESAGAEVEVEEITPEEKVSPRSSRKTVTI